MNCSQNLAPQGFCDSTLLPCAPLACLLENDTLPSPTSSPDSRTSAPVLVQDNPIYQHGWGTVSALQTQKATLLLQSSSPSWLNTSWVLWSLPVLNREDKLNMPTAEPGEELCTQIQTCADGLVVKLTLPHFHMNSAVARTVKGSKWMSKSSTIKY